MRWLLTGVFFGSNLGTSPQGTFVIPLLVSAHRDSTQFKDPECFNPTNFLNDQGDFQSNAFMPFALGLGWAGRGPVRTCSGMHRFLTPHPCPQESGHAWVQAWPQPHLHSTVVLPAPCGEPLRHRPRPAVPWAEQCAPSLPAPPRGLLKSDSAQLTGSQTSLPSSVHKGLNCRWRTLLIKKREQESQMCAALR